MILRSKSLVRYGGGSGSCIEPYPTKEGVSQDAISYGESSGHITNRCCNQLDRGPLHVEKGVKKRALVILHPSPFCRRNLLRQGIKLAYSNSSGLDNSGI